MTETDGDAAPAVAVLGLGLMGSALARALIAAGLDVTVWNRGDARREPFASSPARVAASVAEAVGASEIVVVCVRDYDAADDHLRAPAVEAALGDKVVVQLSTGTPTQARRTSAWATQAGAQYLDGSIMGFPDAVGTDGLVVLYAGDQAAFERCAPVIDGFGGTAMMTGEDPGSAAGLDNALLTIYYGFLFGTLHGAAICDAEGISLDVFAELGEALMPVLGDALTRSVAMITSNDFESEQGNLDTSLAAISHIGAVSRDAGLDDRFIACLRTYAAEAIDAGHGALGSAALFTHLRHN